LLTSRGWWFLVILLLLGGLGIRLSVQAGDAIALFSLTLLAWFLWEWAQFAYRYYLVLPRLIIDRELSDERKAVPILWAGGEFDVRVRISIDGSGDLPFVILADWIPTDGKLVEGSEEVTAALGREPAEIKYRLKCPVPGELRFEGVRVRIADRQGFFYHRTLIRDGSTYPVLPRLTGAEGQRRGSKKINIFPPPGVHRLKRPGGGSELLDLRDYIPGDPPKMIAWKPSARRDKLFTKEFESEVPVRCTLFVDSSEGTRLGAKRTKITRLVNLAAGVAEAAVADRDHAGLVVFDEHDSQVMRPKRSRRHVIDMLHLLSRAASRPTPIGPFADANALAKLAFPMANELYPELMHKRTNPIPEPIHWTFWLRAITWLPYILPFVTKSLFWSPPSDYRRGWWVLVFLVPLLLFCCGLPAGLTAAFQGYPALFANYMVALSGIVKSTGWPGFFIVLGFFTLMAFLLWYTHGLSGFLENWRTERLRRKQLGLLFATLDADRAGAESHYLHDDQIFARRAQRFLADHHARYPVRLYDARGRYLFHGRPKLDVLVKALNYSVARGRDNELFVLLVDLVDLADDLDHLIRAVRVAVARHHQVMVILPWQDDIPDPPVEAADDNRIPMYKAERFAMGGYKAIADELARDYIDNYHRNYFKLRRAFGRLGVIVVRADQEEPVQMVLDRIDRLRGVGRRK
jgi:uncharacterized protein (DUF58 family)